MNKISPKLFLAPMEGVTDFVMRDLLTNLGGIDQCVTEFLRVTDTLYPEKVFFENFGNQVWDMRERYSNLGALLNRAIEFAEKEDWAATNEALNKYYMDSYSLFNELWGWKYPFSIHNYDQHI